MGSTEEKVVAVIMVGGPTKGSYLVQCCLEDHHMRNKITNIVVVGFFILNFES